MAARVSARTWSGSEGCRVGPPPPPELARERLDVVSSVCCHGDAPAGVVYMLDENDREDGEAWKKTSSTGDAKHEVVWRSAFWREERRVDLACKAVAGTDGVAVATRQRVQVPYGRYHRTNATERP